MIIKKGKQWFFLYRWKFISFDLPVLRLSADACRLQESVLQRVPSDRELSQLALQLGAEWESVLLDLGLSAEVLFRCRSDHSLSSQAAALAGLVRWRRAEGKRATVERLLQSLQSAGIHSAVLEDVLNVSS